MITHADRQLWRTYAIPRLVLKEAFHNPIFKGMKSNHQKTPLGSQQVYCLWQDLLQSL